jgi:hypothetical protein
MRTLRFAALILVCSASPVFGQSELAMKFGARESISDISLSPDGKRIAFLALPVFTSRTPMAALRQK